MTMNEPAMSTAMTLPATRSRGVHFGLADAERLNGARDAVPQVRADHDHAEDVKRDRQRIGRGSPSPAGTGRGRLRATDTSAKT